MTDWRKRRGTNLFLLGLGVLAVICLILMGNWQLHRLAWKTDLISKVNTRAYGTPVEAPKQPEWPTVTADTHAYERVKVTGHYLQSPEFSVKAVTDLGPGFWILTPLQRDTGNIIWINRGFVPTEMRDAKDRPAPPAGDVTVTGLLRVTEPEGTLLQSNDPAINRWYSRDVAAFSAEDGLGPTAPYFIDAEKNDADDEWPRGGLTKITFRNNHLQYALTWYGMAIGLAAAMIYVVRLSRRKSNGNDEDDD